MQTHKPKNRYEAMQLARDVEAEFRVLSGEDNGDVTNNKDKELGLKSGNPTWT